VVLAAEGNRWNPDDLAAILKNPEMPPLLGGIFPAIIQGTSLLERGTILIGLRDPGLEVLTIPDLDQVRQVLLPPPQSDDSLYFIFADGLSSGIRSLVEELQFQIGSQGTFLGGGAGSGTFTPIPSVITPEGLLVHAAVICRMRAASAVKVSHGWKVASELLKVTETSGVRIDSLNHRPAFEVYREVLADSFGVVITPEGFGEMAAHYPLGIARLGQEVLVRDPVRLEPNGAIVCVGGFSEGDFVRVLRADPEGLSMASVEARQSLDLSCPPKAFGTLDLTFDCVSRRSILGGGIECEIEALAKGCYLVGALTLGEIAHPKSHRVEFLNKSTVVARLLAVD